MEDITFPSNKFNVWDYTTFAVSLLVSLFVGLYHAFVGSRNKTTQEFLLAGRSMGVLPISMSILATFISAISLMGVPAEIITNGSQFVFILFGYTFAILLNVVFFLPVFHALNITSVFEYIEMRFGTKLRLIICVIYIVQTIFYMGIVLYIPCLALQVVTGLNKWLGVVLVGTTCILYTSLGGMKAVLWTDVVQTTMMTVGMAVVVIRGLLEFGGISPILKIYKEHGRLEFFNFSLDPRVQNTALSTSLGGTIMWLSLYAVNQAQVQRVLCTPTLRQSKMAMLWNIPGLSLMLCLCFGCGLVSFAHYFKCDPVKVNRIGKYEEILPLYIMDMLHYVGFAGFLTACVLCGALSSISSGLNSLAAIFLKDILAVCLGQSISEKKSFVVLKIISLISGFVMILFTVVISKMGSVLSVTQAVFGMLGGPCLGVFVLGIFVPRSNSKGAMAGLFCGLTAGIIVAISSQITKPSIPPTSPMKIHGCRDMYSFGVSSNDSSFFHSSLNYTDVELNEVKNYNGTSNRRKQMNGAESILSISQANVSQVRAFETSQNIVRVKPQTTKDSADLHTLSHMRVNWWRYFSEMSTLWYCSYTVIVSLVLGVLVSVCTGGEKNLKTELLSPFLNCHKTSTADQDAEDPSKAEQMQEFLFKQINNDSLKIVVRD